MGATGKEYTHSTGVMQRSSMTRSSDPGVCDTLARHVSEVRADRHGIQTLADSDNTTASRSDGRQAAGDDAARVPSRSHRRLDRDRARRCSVICRLDRFPLRELPRCGPAWSPLIP